MGKDEFVQLFVDKYGFEPDPEDLEELFPRQRQQRGQLASLPRSRRNYPAEGLLGEINDLFSDIAYSARLAAKRSAGTAPTVDPRVKEFGLMLMLFIVKAAGYFVMRAAFEEGYDPVI